VSEHDTTTSHDAPATPDPQESLGSRERPYDPAGTRPKHRLEDLLPVDTEPLLANPSSATVTVRGDVVDGDAVEEPWSTISSHTATPPTGGSSDFDVRETDDGELLPARRAAASSPAVAEPAAIPPRAQARLQFILGALLAVGAAGVAIALLVAFAPESQKGPVGPQWSQWRPDGDGNERVMEIADRVGRQYRFSGQQLVAVTGGPLEVAGLPLDVVLRESAEQGGDLQLERGKGILYRLCGLGDKCAISSGKPSRERHLLLRREALELALYTFHYVDVDQVVVFMPPPKGKDPNEALFFKRSDLEPQIEQPLTQSLEPRTPSVKSVTTSPDSSFVNDVTIETLFNFTLQQQNSDSRAFLILDPLSAKTN